MFGGIGIGFLLRKVEIFQKINKPIFWTILLLLFFLGISVGNNDAIMSNLQVLGFQALILAVFGTLGSALAALVVYKLFFKEIEKR